MMTILSTGNGLYAREGISAEDVDWNCVQVSRDTVRKKDAGVRQLCTPSRDSLLKVMACCSGEPRWQRRYHSFYECGGFHQEKWWATD